MQCTERTSGKLQDDSYVLGRVDDIEHANDVGMLQLPENLNLPLDLVRPLRVLVELPSTDELDRDLNTIFAVDTELDLSELALTERLQENVLAQSDHRSVRVRLLEGVDRGVEDVFIREVLRPRGRSLGAQAMVGLPLALLSWDVLLSGRVRM